MEIIKHCKFNEKGKYYSPFCNFKDRAISFYLNGIERFVPVIEIFSVGDGRLISTEVFGFDLFDHEDEALKFARERIEGAMRQTD
jgi:hypothetical protein